MGSGPRHWLLIICDAGKMKGGNCYGSFSIGGFPGESPLVIYKIELSAKLTSTQAEAAILLEALKVAIDGMKARRLRKKTWGIKLESDSQTLINKLSGTSGNAGKDFVSESVRQMWALLVDFGEVKYEWVKRERTVATFGH